MPINYQERTEEEYRRRASVMIQNFEGYRDGPYDAGDRMATIGFGYTFNRNNNVELWDRAGVQLSQTERQRLAAIDRAPDAQKTALGLAFDAQITREEARSLLENASLSRYEGPAGDLGMPFSDERATVVSITYNRGPGRMATHMQGFNDAIADGDRAEAWYQMRYNSFGTAAIGTNNELGIRARRNMESQIFGLYDDPSNATPEEARNVYRMFQLHRDDIVENERNWGVDLDGNQARRSAIAQANGNYPDLVREYGQAQTLASALEPARNRLLEELRTENPTLADRLRNEDFATTAIYLDPGRELRTGNNLRPEQRNNTSQDVDENHAAIIDSRRMRGITEVENNDLLIGGGGDDTLRSHRGNDILIGSQGRDRMEGGGGRDTYVIGAGDTVLDSDGSGEVRWGGQQLTGGVRSELDPVNTYRSADGRFTYTVDGNNLSIIDTLATDQALQERAVIENFQSGQLGITLSGPSIGGVRPQTDPQQSDEQERQRMIDADRAPDNAIPGRGAIDSSFINPSLDPPAPGPASDERDLDSQRGAPERQTQGPATDHVGRDLGIDQSNALSTQSPSRVLADQPGNPSFRDFDLIRTTALASGRWNDEESRSIAASLLKEHTADPLCKRLDNVAVGRQTANGEVNVFGVYSPFGEQSPHFTTRVDGNQASKEPVQANLEQVEQIRQQQAQDIVQQQTLQQNNAAQRGPHLSA